MRKALLFVIAAGLLLAAGCRDRDTLRRDQQQYEIVQEGAGGAVTGTIHGPGETLPPPMPPLTGTNADTTTAFTMPATAMPGQPAPPGTIAGSLQNDTASRSTTQAPAPRRLPPPPDPPRSEDPPQRTTQPEQPEPVPEPVPEPEPEPEREPEPPPPPPPGADPTPEA